MIPKDKVSNNCNGFDIMLDLLSVEMDNFHKFAI